jgi:hypothetical protein
MGQYLRNVRNSVRSYSRVKGAPPRVEARMRTPRRFAAALPAVLLASLAVGMPSAHASTESITCSGSETLTYNPGLKLFERTVTLDVVVNFGPCISTNPAISSGTAATPPGGVPAKLSCLNLLDSPTGVASIRWNNGTKSRYSFNQVTSTLAGQLVATTFGTVIEGPFLGRSLSIVFVSPAPNLLNCLSPSGLTARSGPVTLSIV